MSVLSIEKLEKKFSGFGRAVTALKEVSLAVADREFFVLLGPSGCGKSTMLNCVAGLEKPTGGTIRCGEDTFCDTSRGVFYSPRQRNVAMVFQDYALYPHMSVFDNIAFPLVIGREPREKIEQAVTETAHLLGLGDYLGSKPGQLSGGQRQRVAIGRAIVREPNLFLLDEPLSNLDAQLRSSMRAELKQLQRRLGITTLYVTHDQIEAMTLGDRIAVLRDGGIEQVGTPAQLYEQPANTFVATFVGIPPMNILRVEKKQTDAGNFLVLGGEEIVVPPAPWEKMEQCVSSTLLMGIRPEHIQRKTDDSGPSLTVQTRVVEMMGRESLVLTDMSGQDLSFLCHSAIPRVNETGALTFNWEQVHFFDPRTKERI